MAVMIACFTVGQVLGLGPGALRVRCKCLLSSVLSVMAISPKELAGSQGEPGIMGAEPRALSMAVSWGFAKATTMSASPIFAFSENRGIPVKLLICIDFLMNAVKRSFRRLGGFLQPAAVFSSRRWWALAGESGAWLPKGVLRPRERESSFWRGPAWEPSFPVQAVGENGGGCPEPQVVGTE